MMSKTACKANWFQCLTNFTAVKIKHAKTNQKKLTDIDFAYRIEDLGLNKPLKEAIDKVNVGEYIDCRRKPTMYNSEGLNKRFNHTKQFEVSNRGQVILRIA
jgi:hypothetical protein